MDLLGGIGDILPGGGDDEQKAQNEDGKKDEGGGGLFGWIDKGMDWLSESDIPGYIGGGVGAAAAVMYTGGTVSPVQGYNIGKGATEAAFDVAADVNLSGASEGTA